MESKVCTRCHELKSFDCYRDDVRYTGGKKTWCKGCESAYGKERRAKAVMPQLVPSTKICAMCHQEKEALAFQPKRDASDGLSSWCRECNREYQREWSTLRRASSPEKVERMREHCRSYHRRLRATPESREKQNRYQSEVRKKSWQNPEWVDRHRRSKREYHQRAKNNPDYIVSRRLATMKRHARKKQGSTCQFTRDEWYAILESFGHQCAYCQAADVPLEQEHVIPISRGGEHSARNIVPACRTCNARKSSKTPEEAGMPIIAKRS